MFFALVVLAVAAPASTAAKPAVKGHSVTITLDAPVGGGAYVSGHLLNCRTEPAITARILTTVPRGTRVAVRKQKGEWQYLKLKTKSCWASTRYLSTTEISKPATPD